MVDAPGADGQPEGPLHRYDAQLEAELVLAHARQALALAGRREENASSSMPDAAPTALPLRAAAAAVQAALGAQRDAACADLACIERVLRSATGSFKAERDLVTVAELRGFLGRFGPLRLAMGRAGASLFALDGRLRPGFWGRLSARRAAQRLEGQPPGTYLVRFSPSRVDKVVVSSVTRDGVRHCGLTNLGCRGFAVRAAAGEDGQPLRVFESVAAFVQAAAARGGLLRALECPAAARWSQGVEAEAKAAWLDLESNPAALEAAPLAPEPEALSVDPGEGEDCVRPLEVERECSGECAKARYASLSVSTRCDACKVSWRDPAESLSVLFFRSSGATRCEPEQMDALLRKGAEKFRTGQRSDAEELFREVLSLAEANMSFSQQRESHSEVDGLENAAATGRARTPQGRESRIAGFARRRRRSSVGTDGAPQRDTPPHNERDIWCRCLACASLRSMARALGNLGHIYTDKKRIPEAVAMYLRSLPLLREMGMWKQEPLVLSSLVTCAYASQDTALASAQGIDYLGTLTQEPQRDELLKRLEALGATDDSCQAAPGTVEALLREGDAINKRGSAAEAMRPYARALRLARCQSDSLLEVNALLRLGCCLYISHRLRDAIVHFERAVLLLRSNNIAAVERGVARKRVDLHNTALSFAKQANMHAGWAPPPPPPAR